jgi:hypothetical protein
MRFWRSLRDHLFPSRYNAHRPHLLRKGWLVAFLGVALISEAAILGHSLINQGPNVFLAAVVRSDVIADTDQARTSLGGQALTENEVLDAAAQAKADDMAAKGYFAHISPDGTQPWAWFAKAGYDYVYAGENLAVRFDDSQAVVDAWMASPAHRANIVKPQYRDIGIGIAQGEYKGGPATFVVQFFASPSVAAAAAKAAAEVSQVPQAQGSVAGAQVEPAAVSQAAPVQDTSVAPVPAPKPSFIQSLTRSLAKAFSESRNAGTWALGVTAALLLTVLALTFFIRIQVQPTDLILPGLAVAMVALTLMAANAKFLPTNGTQSASVAQSQGDIGDAASVQAVNVAFPQAPNI